MLRKSGDGSARHRWFNGSAVVQWQAPVIEQQAQGDVHMVWTCWRFVKRAIKCSVEVKELPVER
jgi:hypothetical protein